MFLLLALACTGDKDPTDSGLPPAAWELPAQDLDAALLGVTGNGGGEALELVTVGADAGDGPLVLRFAQGAWSRIATGTTGDLWWVHRADDDLYYLAGAEGRVLRYQPSSGQVQEERLPEAQDHTLFGVWGSEDDLWAVGGNIDLAADGAGIWRRQGGTWTAQALPAEAAARVAVYKVWGSSPSDLWFVGTEGLVLRWDGTRLLTVDSGTTRNLFTVHGRGSEAWAVGGYGDAAALHWDGSTWTDESPEFTPQFNGVFAPPGDEPPVAVGAQGTVCHRQDGAWQADPRGPATFLDLHSAWVDGDGALWSVGGAISAQPMRQGLVVYGGELPIPDWTP